MQILGVDQMLVKTGYKCICYGKSGVGKTSMIATAPKPIILDIEGGLIAVKGKGLPQLPRITNIQEMFAAHRWFTADQQAKQFQTICIDSIAEIAEVCLKSEKGKSTNKQAAYGEMADTVLSVLRLYRDIPGYNVYMTCKEEYDKNFQTGGMYWQPSLPGRVLAFEVPYIFDGIFRLQSFRDPQTGTYPRWLQTQPDENTVAKDRTGRLAAWEAPDLSAIIAKANG